MTPSKTPARLAALEAQAERHETAEAIVAEARRPRTRGEIRDLLIDLLAAKLEASRAVAEAARAAMSNPAWVACQGAEGLEQLGAYLDGSTFALGDRLAGHATTEAHRDPQ